jgi:NAD(P)-dependent dehydrogenase (short-subunit alcohol dehydrogenase family)
VLLTGSRIKIGQQICLSLLRCGATVIATTRFPVDMQQRYAQMEDFAVWGQRLHIYRVDLRNLGLVTAFCHFLRQRYRRLYAIVNNAAQTVARPPVYYANLVERELAPPLISSSVPDVPEDWDNFVRQRVGVACTGAAGPPLLGPPAKERQTDAACGVLSSLAAPTPGPREWYDMYDTWQTARDTRDTNSWTQELGEISGEEAAEVHAINALAPFILNSELRPLLFQVDEGEDEAERQRFVINVSAMEGQFYRYKSAKHPHTNMAKASLNMMTRTAAQGYAQHGIFMNAVDTGWITDENPMEKAQQRLDRGLTCPLDEIDAAARVLDLIYTQSREFGKFWKDYREVPW